MYWLHIGIVLVALSPGLAHLAPDRFWLAVTATLASAGWLCMLAGRRGTFESLLEPREQDFDPPRLEAPENCWTSEQLDEIRPPVWSLERELTTPPPRSALLGQQGRRRSWIGAVSVAGAGFAYFLAIGRAPDLFVIWGIGLGAAALAVGLAVVRFVTTRLDGRDLIVGAGAAPAEAVRSTTRTEHGWFLPEYELPDFLLDLVAHVLKIEDGDPVVQDWTFRFRTPREERFFTVTTELNEYRTGEVRTVLYDPGQQADTTSNANARLYERIASGATDTSGALYVKFGGAPPGSDPPPPDTVPAAAKGPKSASGLVRACLQAGATLTLAFWATDPLGDWLRPLLSGGASVGAFAFLAWQSRDWLDEVARRRFANRLRQRGRPVEAVVIYEDRGDDGGYAVFQYVLGKKLYTAAQRHFDPRLWVGDHKIALYDAKRPQVAMMTGLADYRTGPSDA